MWVLDADYGQLCYEGRWNIYAPLAFAMFCLYTIGIPVFFWHILHTNREHLVKAREPVQTCTAQLHIDLKIPYTPVHSCTDTCSQLHRLVQTLQLCTGVCTSLHDMNLEPCTDFVKTHMIVHVNLLDTHWQWNATVLIPQRSKICTIGGVCCIQQTVHLPTCHVSKRNDSWIVGGNRQS